MESVKLIFECGCFVIYWGFNNISKGGLSCCPGHEKPYQVIENILPLKLVKVEYSEDKTI